ncbi:hypothetical protein V6N12_027720 [Hibiscus sabdariffa]|uniref:Pentatricopeptide repeat-containing protein n=1 Tax=Hibiscus sabdariffa TaxID=183260 RepID=A0ABR2F3P6_9ROSI
MGSLYGLDMYAKYSDILAARDVFSRMLQRDVVSWTSILVGAAQHGQAEEALSLYNKMFGMDSTHVCWFFLVDPDTLEEAETIITSMPFKPEEPTWAALLSACKQYGNAKMVIRFAYHLLSLNPEEPSTYILLSNIYGIPVYGNMLRKQGSCWKLRKIEKNRL